MTLDNTANSTEYTLATITTWFDLLGSTISPERLLEVAQQRKLHALGIVDHAKTLAHARPYSRRCAGN